MAVRFDASSDAYTATTGLPGGTWTAVCWLQLVVDRNAKGTILKLASSGGNVWWLVDVDGTTLYAGTDTDGVGFAYSLTVGAWQRLALVSTGTALTLYHGTVTGAVTTSGGACGGIPTAPTSFNLGGDGVFGHVDARIAGFKMYSAALTAAELLNEWEQYHPVRTANLLRYHPFVNAETVDYSGNGRTLNAGSTATTTEPGPPTRWARSITGRLIVPAAAQTAAVDDTAAGADTVAADEGVDVADTGVGSDTAAADDTTTTSDTGVGSDTAATEDVVTETTTVSDTATGADTVATTDADSAAVDDTAAGADTVAAYEGLDTDDTAAGTHTVAVTDAVPALDDAAAGSDTAAAADASDADDTGSATDVAVIDEALALADTGAGTDTATVNEPGDITETGAGVDHAAVLDVGYARLLPYRPGPTYELVVVARIPSETGPPTLIEVDPIRWTSLRYTDELSKPQQLEASCLISTLPESITRRMEGDPNTELLLLRNGRPVFAGPLVGWRAADGDTLTVTAHGVLAYLQRMVVDRDLVFRQVDQFQIVKGLVDGWQNSPFGHYGIDTTSVGESGQLRDGTYLRDEIHKVGQRVEEMGARINGFDLEVDPQSRRLQLWNPEQGVDRSDGEDAIVFDRRHITSGDVLCSFGPDDLASDGFGNSNTTDGNTLWSTRHNAELRAKYGRSAVVGSWSNIERQDTLDDHVQALVDSRGRPLLVPGPNLRVTVDADLDDYGVGDTVRYEVHERLGVSGAFRIRRQTVTVAAPSQEQVSLEFV